MAYLIASNLFVFVLLMIILFTLSRKSFSLSQKVFSGLVLGILFGVVLHYFYTDKPVLDKTMAWIDIIGNGYIKLLQMIVIPLVFCSILNAVAKLHTASALGKISILTIGILLFTTAIAAMVGALLANVFSLDAAGLIQGQQELERLDVLQNNYLNQVSNLTVPELLLSFIPQNVFAAFTGSYPTSVISVVLFSSLLGYAVIKLIKSDAERGAKVLTAIDILESWIMKLVQLIMQLTPYGVMALMIRVVANSKLADIINLGSFVVASYLAIILMFIIHGILVTFVGVNPWRYFQKISPVLLFAFTSRSSAATIPLNIETQVKHLGVSETIASFSASFGATIGQNGCAGIYPAMLAVMIAPSVGINPLDPFWLLTLIGIVTISSIGVAGVGGGATFAALIVLPAMGLPITLVALLISIEPLIDMGRTALNVSGSILAGTVTNQLLKKQT